jgi:hypothetical protein
VGVRDCVAVRVSVAVGAVREALPLTSQMLSKVSVASNEPSRPGPGTPPNWTMNAPVAPAPNGTDDTEKLVGEVESFPL